MIEVASPQFRMTADSLVDKKPVMAKPKCCIVIVNIGAHDKWCV